MIPRRFAAPVIAAAFLLAGMSACGGSSSGPAAAANEYMELRLRGREAARWALLLPAARRAEPRAEFVDVARRAGLRRTLVAFEMLNAPPSPPASPWRAFFRLTWEASGGRKETSWQGLTVARAGRGWRVLDLPVARQEAAEAYAAGEYPRATRVLQRVLRINPLDAEALDLLGYVERDNPAVKNNLELALEAHRQAAALEPKNPDWRLSLGNDFRLLGWHQGAIAEIKKAIELDKRANYYVWLGLAHASARQIDAARAAWRRAIELDPASAQAHAFLEKLK